MLWKNVSKRSASFSKELTKLAIENNLINKGSDAKETAKNVTDFYHTLMETINKNDGE